METAKPNPQPAAPQLSQAKPPATADRVPPWLQDGPELTVADRPVAAAPAKPASAAERPVAVAPARLAPVARRPEAVHWSVVALTLFTAISVVLGARGVEPSHSRELLPVLAASSAP